GLMKGDLQESFQKGDKTITRKMNADLNFKDLDGGEFKLHGRSLMLLRNVGHLMTNPAILVDLGNGNEEIFEGIMDALVTSLLTSHDIKGTNPMPNSRTGSM
ncbi:malate synthase G, partial [Rhizobium hidalgonense]|nr:malate synthase G [Rhizobium hidalgonense]